MRKAESHNPGDQRRIDQETFGVDPNRNRHRRPGHNSSSHGGAGATGGAGGQANNNRYRGGGGGGYRSSPAGPK